MTAKAEISVAVAKPDRKPMKITAIRPKAAIPPLAMPDTLAASEPTATGAAGAVPRATTIAISASAMIADGSSPATNRPPIDRLVTKPRMIRFTQGGMVSAMTAEAASSATASPGFCPDLRAAGTSTDPTAATSAIFEPEMPENTTMLRTMTTFSPPRIRPTPRCSRLMMRTDMPFASIR